MVKNTKIYSLDKIVQLNINILKILKVGNQYKELPYDNPVHIQQPLIQNFQNEIWSCIMPQ